MELDLNLPLHVLSCDQLVIHGNDLPSAHNYTASSVFPYARSRKRF